MSFLNPVNEPVLRFSSTDAGAPQINYAARVAGDVKTVLKACLVTGYGAKPSAGWSVGNEVDHVAEFVSPSAAMSDYRLGIDDTSASSTTWYYQYQDVRVNPPLNTINKAMNNLTVPNVNNGWQLLVTERGILLVEVGVHQLVGQPTARITYWGQVKSASLTNLGSNIAFLGFGYAAASGDAPDFFRVDLTNNRHYSVNGNSSLYMGAANITALQGQSTTRGNSAVDITSALYLYTNSNELVAEQPAFLMTTINKDSDVFGVRDTTIGTRPALYACAGSAIYDAAAQKKLARGVLIPLDYWEY